jgi:hypothetical protein
MKRLKSLRSLWLVGIAGALALLLSGCVSTFQVPTILVGSVRLLPHTRGDIFIQAFGIPGGLQGIEVSAHSGQFLTFDPTVLQVLGVEAVSPFGLDSVNINNSAGTVSFIARTSATGPFPSDGVILVLHVELIGTTGTTLHMTVTNLADGHSQPLPGVTISDGQVIVAPKPLPPLP